MEMVGYGVLLIFLGVFVIFFGRAFFRGAPFAPTSTRAIATMVEFANMKPHERSVDLGAGDGRLVIACARAGVQKAHGYEINPLLVWWANRRIADAKLSHRAHVFRKSLWHVNLSDYDVITLFGIPYIMRELERKLRTELKPGARVISNKFHFPTWKPVQSRDGIHLYVQQ